MKIDFNQKIMTLKGDIPIKNSDRDNAPFTLGDVAAEALLIPEEKIEGVEKARRGNLAMKIIRSETPFDLEIEEVALIKKRVGEVMVPLVVGQAWKMLEKDKDSD